jgi:flagellar basal-body rod protein FlgF
MNSGMYAALSGNVAAMKRMDIISNNLANANTAAFKKDKMNFESMLNGSENQVRVAESTTADPPILKDNVYVDYSQGPVVRTGNTLDIAIDGDGFFVVNTPTGTAYSRQGNFHLSSDGTLVTVDGFPVMGQGGEIRIKGNNAEISSSGVVTVDGAAVGTLNIVDFPKPYNLKKEGGSLFTPQDPNATPQTAKNVLRQGFLEGSNVQTISEMMLLIETNRYFETCSKVIKGYDDMASKATGELGRLG